MGGKDFLKGSAGFIGGIISSEFLKNIELSDPNSIKYTIFGLLAVGCFLGLSNIIITNFGGRDQNEQPQDRNSAIPSVLGFFLGLGTYGLGHFISLNKFLPSPLH